MFVNILAKRKFDKYYQVIFAHVLANVHNTADKWKTFNGMINKDETNDFVLEINFFKIL